MSHVEKFKPSMTQSFKRFQKVFYCQLTGVAEPSRLLMNQEPLYIRGNNNKKNLRLSKLQCTIISYQTQGEPAAGERGGSGGRGEGPAPVFRFALHPRPSQLLSDSL